MTSKITNEPLFFPNLCYRTNSAPVNFPLDGRGTGPMKMHYTIPYNASYPGGRTFPSIHLSFDFVFPKQRVSL